MSSNDPFTKLHNEVLEAVALQNISGAEARILFVLWRKTYGYGKKEDWISASQFQKLTGLANRTIRDALNSLQQKQIISRLNSVTGFSKEFIGRDCSVGAKPPTEQNRHGGIVPPPPEQNRPHKRNYYKRKVYTKNTPTAVGGVTPQNSQNSLTPCTPQELWEIAHQKRVALKHVHRTHEAILEKIEEKTFKNKTVHKTLMRWIELNKVKGYIQELDELGMLDLESETPERRDLVKAAVELVRRREERGERLEG